MTPGITPVIVSTRSDAPARARGAGRVVGVAAQSAGCGALIGAVAGSIVPLYGTAVGLVIGVVTGLVASLCFAGTLRRKWYGVILAWATIASMLVAVAFIAVAWLAAFLLPIWNPVAIIAVLAVEYTAVTAAFVLVVRSMCRRNPDIHPASDPTRCITCDYDLTGLRDDVCPECGRASRPSVLTGPG